VGTKQVISPNIEAEQVARELHVQTAEFAFCRSRHIFAILLPNSLAEASSPRAVAVNPKKPKIARLLLPPPPPLQPLLVSLTLSRAAA